MDNPAEQTDAQFQSTRPYGARRRSKLAMRYIGAVSIHAPVRGATVNASVHRRKRLVSIHAPVRGATRRLIVNISPRTLFQSTRPYGARLKPEEAKSDVIRFQSTRPYGARHPDLIKEGMDWMFQSTRPYGARHFGGRVANTTFGRFNPRARTGRDDAMPDDQGEYVTVSIHAPVRGATATMRTRAVRRLCFNPRARTGRDPCLRYRSLRRAGFNPRARTGRDFNRFT